jgi:hypothetical protein
MKLHFLPSILQLQSKINENKENLSNAYSLLNQAKENLFGEFICFLFSRYDLENEFFKSVEPYIDIPLTKKQMLDLLKVKVKKPLIAKAICEELHYTPPCNDCVFIQDLTHYFFMNDFILEYSTVLGAFRLYLNTEEGKKMSDQQRPYLQRKVKRGEDLPPSDSDDTSAPSDSDDTSPPPDLYQQKNSCEKPPRNSWKSTRDWKSV